MMKKEKILEIWHTFDATNTENVFYSIICDDGVLVPIYLNDVYLFGKIYKEDSNEPYIEIAGNILSELIVPESLARGDISSHAKTSSTYRVAVFLVNGRLFVIQGIDRDGMTVADTMDGYQHLFTATYDRDSYKWTIPVSDIVKAFSYESPLSTGVDKNFGEHISKLCHSFGW